MRAVWMAGRAQLRYRRANTVALALLVGLSGGAVLAAVAGASRTASAMDRFAAFSRPEDVYVSVNGPPIAGGQNGGPPPGATPDQIQALVARIVQDRKGVASLPQVEEVGRAPYMFMAPDRQGRDVGQVNPFAAADAHMFHTMDRPLLLRGRMPRLGQADETAVDDVTAQLRHLRVGSRITMWSYSPDQNVDPSGGLGSLPVPAGQAYTFRVVGIIRDAETVNAPPVSVTKSAVYDSLGGMVLTPPFLQRFADDQRVPLEGLPGIEGYRVRLRHGLADLPAFRKGLARFDVAQGDLHVGSDIGAAKAKSQRAIHLEAIALLIVAVLTGLAALLVLGQVLSRQVDADASDNRTLAALGVGKSHLVLTPLVRAALVGLVGAVVAVAVAIALSPLMPIGLARRAEIHQGVSVNTAVLGIGFAAIVVATILRALLPAWRAARTISRRATRPEPGRPGLASRLVGGGPFGPPAALGIGMSVEREGGVAARGAMAAAAVAVAASVAALTFGVSLAHLVHTPREQGWNWDVVVGNPNDASALTGDPKADVVHQQMVDALARNRDVGEYAGLASADVTIDGRPVSVVGIQPIAGAVWETIVAGRVPRSAGEIMLGRDSLRQLHKRVGQTVEVTSGGARARMRIVGIPLAPTAGDIGTRLSSGGAMTAEGMRRLVPETPVLQFAVRFRPGTDQAAAKRELLRTFGPVVLVPFVGGEVGDLARVDFLPWVLAGLLVVLGVGGLALTLFGSMRRHRRDLAVLKTLGFVRRQVAATAMWQGIAVGVTAVVIGVPGGIALGRWTWRLVADSVGSAAAVRVPVLAVTAVVPATLVVAAALAAGPAWAAARVQAAQALRAE